MRNLHILPIAVLAIGAAFPLAASSKAREYSGYYVSGFERSAFRPIGLTENWWLSGEFSCPGTSIELKPKNEWEATPPVFITVVGTRTTKGRFGHMGAYDRELTVERTISCRPIAVGEDTGL